jgi:hypothetical protein
MIKFWLRGGELQFLERWGAAVVTSKSGVEAFAGGLAVRAQGPHGIGCGCGAGSHTPGPAGRAGGAPGFGARRCRVGAVVGGGPRAALSGQDALDFGDVSVLPLGMDDVADWTSKRRASGGQSVLGDALSEVPAGGRASGV